MNIIETITIPNYIRKVRLSEARRAKYYKSNKARPKAKKYQDSERYKYNRAGFLIDTHTMEKVIANPKAMGTPNEVVINGQSIYNGTHNKHIRNKIINSIKDSFKPYIEKINPLPNHPLKITIEIHNTIVGLGGSPNWDLDNHSQPYIKAFQDILTKEGKIIDDNILFITRSPDVKFIPIEDEADRKLVFMISKEDDERVIKHPVYEEYIRSNYKNYKG